MNKVKTIKKVRSLRKNLSLMTDDQLEQEIISINGNPTTTKELGIFVAEIFCRTTNNEYLNDIKKRFVSKVMEY